jgi:hypothetical protein
VPYFPLDEPVHETGARSNNTVRGENSIISKNGIIFG